MGRNTRKRSGRIETAGDFFVIVHPYVCKLLKKADDDYGFDS